MRPTHAAFPKFKKQTSKPWSTAYAGGSMVFKLTFHDLKHVKTSSAKTAFWSHISKSGRSQITGKKRILRADLYWKQKDIKTSGNAAPVIRSLPQRPGPSEHRVRVVRPRTWRFDSSSRGRRTYRGSRPERTRRFCPVTFSWAAWREERSPVACLHQPRDLTVRWTSKLDQEINALQSLDKEQQKMRATEEDFWFE